MQCPRCSLPLVDVGDVHACLRCNGVFLAAAANDTVTRALDDAAHATAERIEAQGAGRLMNRGAACACPLCGVAMSRFRVGPVEVDTCHAHGSWYDRRELALVREELLEGAPTSTVEPKAPPRQGAASNADEPTGLAPSGLKLARAPERRQRKPRDAVTPLHGMPAPGGGGGGIDPGASRAIDALRTSERHDAEHRRHHHHRHRHHHHHTDSVDVAIDVIDTVFDIFD